MMYITEKCELNREEKILVRSGRINKTYSYKINNLNLFSGKGQNSFALFESVVYNENISRLIPFKREVCLCYELVEKTVVYDFEKEEARLKNMSLNNARQKLLAGEIVEEKTNVLIVGDKMVACTTIKLIGNLND